MGNHPVLSHLWRGFSNQCPPPPSRRLFPSRNVASVFAVFDGLPRPLDFSALQRRCSFFVAIASSRRPSELASLRCDPDGVRFLPSQLSKADRQTRMGLPILFRRLPPSSPHCPVAALEDLLLSRTSLGIRHNYVFSSPSSPHHPISVSAFSNLIRWAFRQAGIDALSSSTRHISVSDAVGRGLSIDDALCAGDWSGASTFFRHYFRPSGVSW